MSKVKLCTSQWFTSLVSSFHQKKKSQFLLLSKKVQFLHFCRDENYLITVIKQSWWIIIFLPKRKILAVQLWSRLFDQKILRYRRRMVDAISLNGPLNLFEKRELEYILPNLFHFKICPHSPLPKGTFCCRKSSERSRGRKSSREALVQLLLRRYQASLARTVHERKLVSVLPALSPLLKARIPDSKISKR